MPKFVQKLEIRLLSPWYTVIKSNISFTRRLYHALVDELVMLHVRVKWVSNGRLEFDFAGSSCNWDDLERTLMPLLVNGRLLSRSPGEEGYLVMATYFEPGPKSYTYNELFSETYPQFTKCSEWITLQRRLFGNHWDEADERALHN